MRGRILKQSRLFRRLSLILSLYEYWVGDFARGNYAAQRCFRLAVRQLSEIQSGVLFAAMSIRLARSGNYFATTVCNGSFDIRISIGVKRLVNLHG